MDIIDQMKEHIANGGTIPILDGPRRGIRTPGAMYANGLVLVYAYPTVHGLMWNVRGAPRSEEWIREFLSTRWKQDFMPQ